MKQPAVIIHHDEAGHWAAAKVFWVLFPTYLVVAVVVWQFAQQYAPCLAIGGIVLYVALNIIAVRSKPRNVPTTAVPTDRALSRMERTLLARQINDERKAARAYHQRQKAAWENYQPSDGE